MFWSVSLKNKAESYSLRFILAGLCQLLEKCDIIKEREVRISLLLLLVGSLPQMRPFYNLSRTFTYRAFVDWCKL